MNKPIIGIVSKHYKDYGDGKTDTYIRDEVKQAIFDVGGIAIGILPPDRDIKPINDEWKEDLSEEEYNNLILQIELCDGIVIQGGRASDNYECIVAKYCYDNDIPTMGICCGQNIMVRALGGTTFKIPNPEEHMKEKEDYAHSIKIDKSSEFYKIIEKEEIMVNSRHKKAIKTHPGLDKVAYCPDGYPEIVEAKNKKFYMAFRFHPESLYLKDDNMKKIFEHFINIC